jgi:hypothetical protein
LASVLDCLLTSSHEQIAHCHSHRSYTEYERSPLLPDVRWVFVLGIESIEVVALQDCGLVQVHIGLFIVKILDMNHLRVATTDINASHLDVLNRPRLLQLGVGADLQCRPMAVERADGTSRLTPPHHLFRFFNLCLFLVKRLD